MTFGHLKKLDISERRAWCPMPELGPGAAIEGRPATEANADYFDAMQRLAAKRAREARLTNGRASAELIRDHIVKNREEDRDLYPRHVLTGWRGVLSEDGDEVSFSVDLAVELCAQLPGDLMDRLRNYFGSVGTFRDQADYELPSAAELAGNSGRDSSGS